MKFLQFDSLKNISGLRHAITTRGGSCAGPYDDLNLAYHVGDNAERVTANRKRLAAELGYDAASLVTAQQVHASRIQFVSEMETGQGAFDWESAIPNCDGLIVGKLDSAPTLIQVADCAPIILVDEYDPAFSVIHAGWRGATAKIASLAAELMRARCFTDWELLRVGIGPCLCVNCFEIGPEVVEAAQKIAPESIIQRSDWQKPHLDLRLLMQRDLESAGVPSENIEIMPHCPRCNNDMFFSHRGQNGIAGRFGLVAWWEE